MDEKFSPERNPTPCSEARVIGHAQLLIVISQLFLTWTSGSISVGTIKLISKTV